MGECADTIFGLPGVAPPSCVHNVGERIALSCAVKFGVWTCRGEARTGAVLRPAGRIRFCACRGATGQCAGDCSGQRCNSLTTGEEFCRHLIPRSFLQVETQANRNFKGHVPCWQEAAEPGCPLQRSRPGVNWTRRGQTSSVVNDPSLCENAKAINRDRTSSSFKTISCADLASAFNFEIEIKNIILGAFRTFEFSHSLDPSET
jgi:hypothetical protein